MNNAEYVALVSQLAAEDFERSDLKSVFGNRDGSAYALLKVIISRLTSKLTAKIPYINHPYVEFITGTTSQVYVSLATQFQRLIDTALRLSQERPKPLTLSGISETFIRVFQDLQAIRYRRHRHQTLLRHHMHPGLLQRTYKRDCR